MDDLEVSHVVLLYRLLFLSPDRVSKLEFGRVLAAVSSARNLALRKLDSISIKVTKLIC